MNKANIFCGISIGTEIEIRLDVQSFKGSQKGEMLSYSKL